MSSKFLKSLFISALVALPLPLALPYVLSAVIDGSVFSDVLSSAASTQYYVLTWSLATLAGLITVLLSGNSQGQTKQGNAKPKTNKSKGAVSHDNAGTGPEGEDRGVVKWFNVNKGFGFITTESGEDIFVHFRSIRGSGRRSLRQGQKVRFDVSEGDKGLQADNVSVVGE